jgi:hypothetical protein
MITSTGIVDQVKDIFEKVTYMDFSAVDLDANLEDDLGIDMDSDFPRIVAQLRKQFHLPADTEEILLDSTTLKQVVGIVREETELG